MEISRSNGIVAADSDDIYYAPLREKTVDAFDAWEW